MLSFVAIPLDALKSFFTTNTRRGDQKKTKPRETRWTHFYYIMEKKGHSCSSSREIIPDSYLLAKSRFKTFPTE